MAKRPNIRDLQRQVRESTRGNAKVDQQLHKLLYPDVALHPMTNQIADELGFWRPTPRYTSSIEAALRFAEAFLGPLFRWHRVAGVTRVYTDGSGTFAASSWMNNEALALVDAAFGAVLAMHGGDKSPAEVKFRRAA